jgi:hypothetical protein
MDVQLFFEVKDAYLFLWMTFATVDNCYKTILDTGFSKAILSTLVFLVLPIERYNASTSSWIPAFAGMTNRICKIFFVSVT